MRFCPFTYFLAACCPGLALPQVRCVLHQAAVSVPHPIAFLRLLDDIGIFPQPGCRRPPTASSNVSSNADDLDRTNANYPEHVDADHPNERTASDGFDTGRARLVRKPAITAR